MEDRYPGDHIKGLAHKWRRGKISRQEMNELTNWYERYQDDIFELSGEYEHQPNKIKQRIEREVFARISQEDPAFGKKQNLWSKIGVAASIILIAGAGLFYYQNYSRTYWDSNSNYGNAIVPGKQGATLTLANGKKIKLSDEVNGELAKESGVTISKTADGQISYEIQQSLDEVDNEGQINTLSTAKGETYSVKLPDGSMVILNAASSITYNANIAALDERRVKLNGEAYFEVVKDKVHPFIVETERQKVEVLGTHFNISAYRDELTTKTTLVEGSVRLNNSIVLKPDEQATLSMSGNVAIENIDIREAIAWKDGKFIFNSEDITSVMRKLSRWYNVEIVYKKERPGTKFTGIISRYDDISKVLNKINYTGHVHISIEGRRIMIMP